VTNPRPIHPFPARMSADIALNELTSLPVGSLILDPMAGSGTVLRMASEQGHSGIGFDSDPLAVLMAKVWTIPVQANELRRAAAQLVKRAEAIREEEIILPWIDDDAETREFIGYWFGDRQAADLRKLSYALSSTGGAVGDALQVTLSKIIVTKQRGASLAWDVSHSRPHRVRNENDFPVMPEFLKAAEQLARRLEAEPPRDGVTVGIGDARDLVDVETSSVDAAITSPPYLNAIDYLRGHKFALVWLGYRIGELRGIRAESIGTERAPKSAANATLANTLASSMGSLDELPPRIMHMVYRYVLDIYAVMAELHRVVKLGGRVVLVVGNSTLRGVFIENAQAVRIAAEKVGFELAARHERVLPPSRRYLPPPGALEVSDLGKRMRTESVLAFARA
jgi:hypothetical protein